jgi:hypothetical protein
MAIGGGETLPKELGTCRGLNGALGHTTMHRIHKIYIRIWIEHKRWKEEELAGQREETERGKQPLTRGRKRPSTGTGGRRSTAGDGGLRWGAEEITRREESQRAEREMWASGWVSGWRPFFKMHYGRTGQSTVPVRCTPDSAQEKEVLARAAGAPDSAQCSVRCTPDCLVSPDRGNFEIFQIFYLVSNQTKSQHIITQNNTCWDRYWHPHIFSHNFRNILP